MLTVYHYPACSTCKKAIKWLHAHGFETMLLHIVDSPPSQKVLGTILKETGLPVRKLFNASGVIYREGGYKDKLATLSDKEALSELAAQGKLIKRPLVVGEGVHLVGFKEEAYRVALSSQSA